MSMIVIVPSRGRPENAARLVKAWKETKADAVLLFGLDDDDETLLDYPRGAWMTISPRLGLVGTLNRLAREVADDRIYHHIGFMGDDHLPRTKHWDKRFCEVLDRFPAAVAYGNDLHQGPNLPTAVFMTASIVRTLGYMAPPRFKHMYVDNVWRDWGSGIGELHYLDDVVIEHMHPDAGKGVRDNSYNETCGFMGPDGEEYHRYRESGLPVDLTKLRAL